MRPCFRSFRYVSFFILFLLIFLPPASGQEKVKIGVITPLTGAIAHSGKDHLIGAEIAADRINAAGGVKVGEKRYLLEIVALDDQYTPDDTPDLRDTCPIEYLTESGNY